jgi:glycine/D-amino acid oxidase-like deaminating enzyme
MPSARAHRSPEVAVIGAGIVGAACALFLARSGARVELFERAFPGAGSSGAGEGNILAWDKELERELPLALRSAALWPELAAELAPDIEYDRKGSIVVTETEAELQAAVERAAVLAPLGVPSAPLSGAELRAEEPLSAPDLPGGVFYPDDAQVEPRLATAALVRRAVADGARLRAGVGVQAIERDAAGCAVALATSAGRVPVGAVVVAAGAWTTALLERCGLAVPIEPRKGQILVLERSAAPVRRKLNEAGYLSAVESAQERLLVAMVVESTRSGTTLIGSSRELVGFDRTVDVAVAAAMARRALRFFPRLSELAVIRTYAGLRPFTPDHLPLIGPLPGAENVCVASGHEGAGIGLAPATGELIAAWHAGRRPPELAGFAPGRFAKVAGA